MNIVNSETNYLGWLILEFMNNCARKIDNNQELSVKESKLYQEHLVKTKKYYAQKAEYWTTK